jgi:hypothetical protein
MHGDGNAGTGSQPGGVTDRESSDAASVLRVGAVGAWSANPGSLDAVRILASREFCFAGDDNVRHDNACPDNLPNEIYLV